MNPPPVPDPSLNPPGKKSSAHHAASASLLAPLMVIFVSVAFHAVQKDSHMPPIANFVAGLCATLLLACGVACAIVGLCGIRQHGSSGILGKSLAGLVINAVLMLVFIGGFVAGVNKGLKSRQAARDLQAAAKDIQAGLRESFDPEKGITNFNHEQVDEFQRKLHAASSNLTGDDALVVKATAAHVGRVQVAGRELEAVVKELTEAHILDFSDVTAKDQLQSRRVVVQRFAEVNQKLASVISNSEALFRADLKRLGVSPAVTDSAMRGFHNAAVQRNSLLLQIRAADARMARGMTGILDLLEENWGAWKHDDATGKILFTRTGLVGPYNQFLDEVQTAGQNEINAQRRLINLRN